MTGMVDDLRAAARRPCGPRPARGYSTATDLADWLVRALELPFREAHHVTGRDRRGGGGAGRRPLDKLPLAAMQAVEPRITSDVFSVLSVESSVESRDELWGNCATERRENGASLDEAVGKGPRQGLELAGYGRCPQFRLRWSAWPFGCCDWDRYGTCA